MHAEIVRQWLDGNGENGNGYVKYLLDSSDDEALARGD